MPTAVTCLWNDKKIRIDEALEVRENEKSPMFLCVSCRQKVKAHDSGGHTSAHFEHIARNPECPLSYSYSYQYGGVSSSSWQNSDAEKAIEGYSIERKHLAHHRNATVVTKCKKRDNYTCRSCGLFLRVNGRSIAECHHLVPLADSGKRVTSVDLLICLCPTCHRIAHTSNPPLPLEEIARLAKSSNKKMQPTSCVGG